MNNALEDLVEAFLRHVDKCKLVERNVYLEGGEVDVIGIDPSEKRIIICEATATSDAYGSKCKAKVEAKFARAKKYVATELGWLGFGKIELQFWAPYVTKEQVAAIATLTPTHEVKVIGGDEYLQRLAKIREALLDSDPRSHNPTCQLMALEQELKLKLENRELHEARVAAAAAKKAPPTPATPI